MPAKSSSSARGVGWAHHKRRKAALAALVDGTPCPFCQEPMLKTQALDLDHSLPRALGGTVGDRLAHASCNRAAGARMTNAIRRARSTRTRVVPTRRSREW